MCDGTVLNIQRMSTEDGPGLRTTVFLKGCTLKCEWCHNPESISFHKEHEWFDTRCMRCGTCVAKCASDAISFVDDVMVIDDEKCEKCFNCSDLCPTNAIEQKGKSWTVDELYHELIKDKAYFENGGGVTLSGGEVLAQSRFATELLEKLQGSGIHTAVDTCGHMAYSAIEKVLPNTSLFLYDIKQMDSDLHQKYTGAGNEMLLENFIKLVSNIKGSDTKLWVRTPLIPGATDSEENIRAIASFLENTASDTLQRWELLAFNNLCAAKYDRLNIPWTYDGVEKPHQNALDRISEIISEYEALRGKAFVTGTASI